MGRLKMCPDRCRMFNNLKGNHSGTTTFYDWTFCPRCSKKLVPYEPRKVSR